MSLITVYSDPHLGKKGRQHYTAESLRRREDYTMSYLSQLVQARPALCLGDFFDSEANDEATILRGIELAKHHLAILGGNHDLPNRVGAACSLEVVGAAVPGIVRSGLPSRLDHDGTCFFFVPHALTNEEYLAKIETAVKLAADCSAFRVLCLHCNLGLSDAFRGAESTLNLPLEAARDLLGTFHHIWIGHEHAARDLFDGRLRVIGSLFPTTFSELAPDSHRYLLYDTQKGEVVSQTVVDARGAKQLLASEAREQLDLTRHLHYVELIDDLPPGEAQRLVVELFKTAFAVRLVQTRPQETEPAARLTLDRIHSLLDVVSSELKEHFPELLELWLELSQERKAP